MQTFANTVGIIALAGLYFLPTIIVIVKRRTDWVAPVILNVLFGWSLIAWGVALWLSLRKSDEQLRAEAAAQSAGEPS